MTLAARLDDFEVTLEHLLMDVFVSKGSPGFVCKNCPLHLEIPWDWVPMTESPNPSLFNFCRVLLCLTNAL
jgi:hypothetical protein